MRTLWYGLIYINNGILVVFVPWCFDIYIDDWRWWVIAMPLSILTSLYTSWRDEKIKQEALKKAIDGK
jgi:hypothetical protein